MGKLTEEKRIYVREQMRAYRAKNPDYIKKENKKYRIYAEKFPEKVAESQRKWKAKNKDKLNEYMKQWKRNNPEKTKKINDDYRKRNIDTIKVSETLKSRRRLKSPGTFTAKEWEEKRIAFDLTCPCCGKKEPEISLTIDHIKPLIKGGTHDISNLQPLCPTCNFKKHTKEISYPPWQH